MLIQGIRNFFIAAFFLLPICASAQWSADSIFFKGAIKERRTQFRDNAINYSIVQKLSQPLADISEDDWETAFEVMLVLHHRTAWIDDKVEYAVMHAHEMSDGFKRSLLEVLYILYPGKFYPQTRHILQQATDAKLFAVAANRLMSSKLKSDTILIKSRLEKLKQTQNNSPILIAFENEFFRPQSYPAFTELFSSNFLRNNIIVYSIQRKNRNFPGAAIIRKADGNFLRNNDSSLFIVPQLALSASNMPAYVTNGNTPQGIFRMFGFGRSGGYFIGPTPNLQLAMPGEYNTGVFYADSTRDDTVWNFSEYKNLLPPALRNYQPLYQSFYAGTAGRSEIIAHGTTIDPNLYAGKSYYPFTPTNGCLATEEWWDETSGKLSKSGQLTLAKAVKDLGGAQGYFVVIDLDDAEKVVGKSDIERLVR